MTLLTHTEDMAMDATPIPSLLDHTDAIATPSEIRRAVLLALRERATLGDKLAEGSIRVIRHLEDQANRLLWQLSPKPEPSDHCNGGGPGGCYWDDPVVAICECGPECGPCTAWRAL